MKTVERQCLYCQRTFNAPIREIKRGNGRFCSIICGAKYNASAKLIRHEPNLVCAYCKTPFYRKPSHHHNATHGLHFCSRACKDNAQCLGGLKEIMPSHYGTSMHPEYRIFALANLPNSCNRCGYNLSIKALRVHHKDRNRSNNTLDNLEILCANCHAIEHNGRAN